MLHFCDITGDRSMGFTDFRDFIRFLYISNGSVAEIQTQLILCVEYGYLMQEDIDVAMDLAIQTAKMLNSLIKTIKIPNGMK
jgi:four helix bundle protein